MRKSLLGLMVGTSLVPEDCQLPGFADRRYWILSEHSARPESQIRYPVRFKAGTEVSIADGFSNQVELSVLFVPISGDRVLHQDSRCEFGRLGAFNDLLNQSWREERQFQMALDLLDGATFFRRYVRDGLAILDFIEPVSGLGNIGDEDGIDVG